MRGLARDGRSPRTSRESRRAPLSLPPFSRTPILSPSPDPFSLLFSSLFFSLPVPLLTSLPPSFLSSLIHILSSPLSFSLSWQSLHGGGVHEELCAPRGSATVYLNSDLRSDTGVKLAKEVSRCLCIQDTGSSCLLGSSWNPSFSQRRNDASRSTVAPSSGGLRNGVPARKLEPFGLVYIIRRACNPSISRIFSFSFLSLRVHPSVELIRRNGPIRDESHPFFIALYNSRS